MSKVTLAITVVGGLVLFSGALILIGAVAMTKFQRVYEAAVFKTLGASTRDDRADAAARVRRARHRSPAPSVRSGAVALTWGVSRYALDIPWQVVSGEHVGGVGADGGARRRDRRAVEPRRAPNKPLATLRAE